MPILKKEAQVANYLFRDPEEKEKFISEYLRQCFQRELGIGLMQALTEDPVVIKLFPLREISLPAMEQTRFEQELKVDELVLCIRCRHYRRGYCERWHIENVPESHFCKEGRKEDVMRRL